MASTGRRARHRPGVGCCGRRLTPRHVSSAVVASLGRTHFPFLAFLSPPFLSPPFFFLSSF